MKKALLFIVLFLAKINCVAEEIQVAMLEPLATTANVKMIEKQMIRGEMVKAIASQSGYAAFSRTDIDQIMQEHNFQQSGMVDDSTRAKLGAMHGVDFVCIMKITKEENYYYLEANLVNIETGKISNPATQYGELQNGSLGNLFSACKALAGELVGRQNQSTYRPYTPSYSSSSSSYPSYSSSSSSSPTSSSFSSSSSSSSPTYSSSPSSSRSQSTAATPSTPSYASAKIESCSSQVKAEIVSCSRSGSNVIFTYRLTNLGLGGVNIQIKPAENYTGASVIFDDSGNSYNRQYMTFRNQGNAWSNAIGVAFPEDLPCTGTVTVQNVPKSATTLTIKLGVWINQIMGNTYISFKNVPIY